MSLLLLFQSPIIQTYFAKQTAAYFSKELQTNITIDRVKIDLTLNLIIKGIYIHDRKNNPLFYLNTLNADIGNINLTEKKIYVNSVELIHPVVSLIQYKGENELNYQFLLDYFATPQKEKVETKSPVWQYKCFNFGIQHCRFSYENQNKQPLAGSLDFNYLHIEPFTMQIKNALYENDTISCSIEKFTLQEKSGFAIQNMSVDILFAPHTLALNNFDVHFPNSKIKMNVVSEFQNFGNLLNLDSLIKTTNTRVAFLPSVVSFVDLAFLHNMFKSKNEKLQWNGKLSIDKGNVHLNDFKVQFRKKTYFHATAHLKGFPDLSNTYVNGNVYSFSTTVGDVQELFANIKPLSAIALPNQFSKLGYVNLKAKLSGLINNLDINTALTSGIGEVNVKGNIKNVLDIKKLNYDIHIVTNNLDVKDFINQKNLLGKITCNAYIIGSGIDMENLNAGVEAEIDALEINQYNYRNIFIQGTLDRRKFDGLVEINDTNVYFKFQGLADFSDSIYQFDFNSTIQNARFAALRLIQRDTMVEASANISIQMYGNDLDNIAGSLNVSNIAYSESKGNFFIRKINIDVNTDVDNKKLIQLNSDVCDATIAGVINLKSIQPSLLAMIEQYLPSFKTRKFATDSLPMQNFDYTIKIKNADTITHLFMPALNMASNTVLRGTINTKQNNFYLTCEMDYLKNKNIKLKNNFFQIKAYNKNVFVDGAIGQLNLADSIFMKNLTLVSTTYNDSVYFVITWDNEQYNIRNEADIKGFLIFNQNKTYELKLYDSKLAINNKFWYVPKGSQFLFDTTSILAKNFLLHDDSLQQITLDGKLSDSVDEQFAIGFKKFNISNFDAVLKKKNVDLDGIFNGTLVLSNIYKSPNILSDLYIEKLAMNGDLLGDLKLNSIWNNMEKAFNINAEVVYHGNVGSNVPIIISGNFYPERKENNYDIDVKLKNFKLKTIERYLSSFASNLRGIVAEGNLKISGKTAYPQLSGEARVIVQGIKINYLNETYRFSHDFVIGNNFISFDSLILIDAQGSKAICYGLIQHSNFRNFSYKISVEPNKLSCLNTTEKLNSLFYGKAFVSGIVKVEGDEKNTNIDITARSEPGTSFFIPIGATSDISENTFITFKKSDTVIEEIPKGTMNLSGITMNFDLTVTPDAEVQIIIDPKIGDIIKGKGNANLRMDIDTRGKFGIYGTYIIEDGEYLFTLQNVINKKFRIEKGGSITWNGDPFDADIDLTAVYKIRTSLYNLYDAENPNIINPDTSNKRVPVDCIIHMTNKLFNPEITFDIDFPTLNDLSREEYKAVVRPNINYQFISLLAINSFVSTSTGSSAGGSQSTTGNKLAGTSGAEFLSNQLSNWLSQISSDFDIGLNYRAGDEISSQELDVALSTQLFNKRVTIDGNVGFGGNNVQQQGNSNIVGDVNMEAKITDDGRYRVKAYNKSNDNNLLSQSGPYTQGVGVLYRREFESFKELFKRKKKNKKKP